MSEPHSSPSPPSRVSLYRIRITRAALGGVIGVVFATSAFLPYAIRWSWSEIFRIRQLTTRQQDLETTVANLRRENHELRLELRRIRDSTLYALESWMKNAPPRPLVIPFLFDTRLPASFDNGDRSLRVVALTFDADAHANAADEILDTLASRGVKATMFLTGRFIIQNRDLVRRIVSEGHEVGNHLYSHPHLTSWAQDRTHTTLPSVTRSFLFTELGRTEQAFESVTGQRMVPVWRAPYGERNRLICAWGQEAGYLHVGWRQGRSWRENLDSNDWVPDESDAGYHPPEEVLGKILDAARREPDGINGGIILMHLGTLRRQRSRQVHLALGRLIDELRLLGYDFVTVTRMAEMSGVDFSLLRMSDRSFVSAPPVSR